MRSATPATIRLQDRLDTFFGLSIQIIGVVFIARLITDAGVRIIYPFIPQISAGLGLSVVGFGWLISARAIIGVTGPIFGVLADRVGRRKIMAVTLLSLGAGVVGLALSWRWWAVWPMLCFGLGTAGFIPSTQAYISDQVSYQKRGRVMGAIELAWALTGIVTLPIFGWMIETFGWRAPFLLLGGLYVIAAGLVWFRLPAVEHRAAHTVSWSQIRQFSMSRPNVLAAMGVSLMLFIAISLFFTVWGIWLSADFGVDAMRLGLVATGIGLAELAGSGVSTLFIDRLGKKRGALLGLLLLTVSYLLLSLTQAILWLAVLGLIVIGLLVEFTIVSLIALYSEQVPEARATVFSLTAFGASIGLALGSPLATGLWERAGLWSISVVSAAALLIAFGLAHQFLKED